MDLDPQVEAPSDGTGHCLEKRMPGCSRAVSAPWSLAGA